MNPFSRDSRSAISAAVISRFTPSTMGDSTTSAPYDRARACFCSGASPGITIVERTPTMVAAAARPCPKLPDENATTPRAAASLDSVSTRLSAPRILNVPVSCSGSAFTRTRPPTKLLSASDSSNGVLWILPNMRRDAASTSAADREADDGEAMCVCD